MELDTRIQVRTNRKLKDEATKTLAKMGISMPTAINMFLSQVVHDQALPFQPKLPQHTSAIQEAESEAAVKVKDIDEMMDIIDRV